MKWSRTVLTACGLVGLYLTVLAAQRPAGPFPRAQAARGKVVYEASCAACHGASLSGGTAPPPAANHTVSTPVAAWEAA